MHTLARQWIGMSALATRDLGSVATWGRRGTRLFVFRLDGLTVIVIKRRDYKHGII
jgi:hypothetical protein